MRKIIFCSFRSRRLIILIAKLVLAFDDVAFGLIDHMVGNEIENITIGASIDYVVRIFTPPLY